MSLLHRRSPPDPVLADHAPALPRAGAWINVTDRPPRMDDLLGRVVLVSFWTYVCGNCTRMLPTLVDLHAATERTDLEIIGVHTPELAVDRHPRNVADAVHRLGLEYPIALDNDFAAWERWGVRAWPTFFLIDRAGRIRRQHVGEGHRRGLTRAVEALIAED